MEWNDTLSQRDQQLVAERDELSRLHALSIRLSSANNLTASLEDVLNEAMAACGADFGHIRLYNPATTALEIVVQRGFRDEFLARYRQVRAEDNPAYGYAVETGERWIVEDITVDEGLEEHRPLAASAGFRGIQSTPLRAYDGGCVGMLTTHFREPHRVSEHEGRLLDLYARLATGLVVRHHFDKAMQETERRRSELAATLANELRQPLQPIRQAADLLREKSLTDPVVARSREVIERQLLHISALLDDMLDVNRIHQGSVALRRSRVSLSSLMESAIAGSKSLFDAGAHQLSVVMPEQAVQVNADAARLSQALASLLGSAASWAPRGGRIRISAEQQGHHVVVAVADEGHGIAVPPEENADGIAGIGLLLARGLVELHGGSLTTRRGGAGRGDELVVRLPVANGSNGNGGHTTVLPPTRFLVVDDFKDTADTLVMVLTTMGHDARAAYDGDEALATAVTFRPEVILLDLELPRLNGYDTCRRIRAHQWGEAMTIIAITGWAGRTARAGEAGFEGTLLKPVDINELLALLAELPRTSKT